MKNFLKSRKLRQGAVATTITIVIVVLIILINVVTTALSSRFGLRIDMTTGKIFSMTDDAKQFLADLDKDVDVYLLSDADTFSGYGTYFQQVVESLNNYARYSDHITVHYVDLIKEPAFATRYPQLNLSANNIVVDGGYRAVSLTPSDLFNTEFDYNTYSTVITSSKAEQVLSSAILTVTAETQVRVTVLSGHNESDASAFSDLLVMNGYEVVEQNLMTDALDEEASIAILNAPQRDLTESDADKLEEWLRNDNQFGRILLVLASSEQQPNTPVLNALLQDWGMAMRSGTVFETNQSYLFQMNSFMTLASYAEDTYSADVKARNLPFALPYSRGLEVLFEEKGTKKTTVLLQFSSGAGIQPLDADSDWTPTDEDIIGAMPAFILSTQTQYVDSASVSSHVLLAGSETMIESGLLSSTGAANGDYLIGMFAKLTGQEKSINIQNKSIETVSLGITNDQVILIVVLMAATLVILIVIGIVVWLRRRHK